MGKFVVMAKDDGDLGDHMVIEGPGIETPGCMDFGVWYRVAVADTEEAARTALIARRCQNQKDYARELAWMEVREEHSRYGGRVCRCKCCSGTCRCEGKHEPEQEDW